MFRITTTRSLVRDSGSAADDLVEKLAGQGIETPRYVMVHMNSSYDVDRLAQRLHELLPRTSIHGATSCGGAITQEGPAGFTDTGMAAFAIEDSDGSYGTGYSSQEGDPEGAAVTALNRALQDAGRDGEIPRLVWISGSPGHEEALIAGIESELGPEVPIIGGSSADNDLSGKWRQFNQDGVGAPGVPGVVISVLFPSVRVGTAFQSAYSPTDKHAVVTKAAHRTILELDHRPARDVYEEWGGGRLSELPRSASVNILSHTALNPLGRKFGSIGEAAVHLLSHPETFTPEGGITLFTDIRMSDEVTFMQGGTETLVHRAGRVADASMRISEIGKSEVSGAIVVYCAGCMLAVRDQLQIIRDDLDQALDGKPYIGTFTFGEQGRVLGERNCHGNLMISTLVFGA